MAELPFAHNFKPKFSATKLSEVCTKPNEWSKNKINFIMRFSPFLELKREFELTGNQILKNSKTLIRKSTSQKIKQGIIDQHSKSSSFNDSIVIASIIKRPLPKVNRIKSDIDENDKQINEINYMADEIRDKKITESNNERAVRCSNSIQRGIFFEKKMINKLNKERNFKFVHNKTKKELDLKDFELTGKVDGFDEENQIILEVKTRNKLTGKVVLKEKRQALVYMKIWQCKKCLLYERGPNQHEENMLEIEWNEAEFENEVVNPLKKFCQKARTLTESQFRELYAEYFNN